MAELEVVRQPEYNVRMSHRELTILRSFLMLAPTIPFGDLSNQMDEIGVDWVVLNVCGVDAEGYSHDGLEHVEIELG